MSEDVRVVSTTTGRVRGTRQGNTAAYLGVPYAAPPVGRRRWLPPQPVRAWSGIRDATAHGPPCLQPRTTRADDKRLLGTENCLTLNVWTPLERTSPLPVMVFLHGGGHVAGSSAERMPREIIYDGRFLADRGAVVLVTLNYRLGPLGFLGHPELTRESEYGGSGNYGHLDQIAALKWVQDNIEQFGGDPKRVLLFGESAGAHSTAVLLASPLAAGLFSRALLQSGSPFTFPQAYVHDVGERLVKALGWSWTQDSAVLSRLRAMPARALMTVLPLTFEVGRGGVTFGPNVDGHVLSQPMLDIFNAGRHNHMPVVLGTTANEYSTMVHLLFPTPVRTRREYWRRLTTGFGRKGASAVRKHYPPDEYRSPQDAVIAILGDTTFICPTRQIARAIATHQVEPVRRYVYAYVADHKWLAPYGAGHGLELPLVFHSFPVPPAPQPSSSDLALSRTIVDYWTRFAATGDPNAAGLPHWPAYDPARDNYLELNTEIVERAGVRTAQCDFWDEQVARASGGAASDPA